MVKKNGLTSIITVAVLWVCKHSAQCQSPRKQWIHYHDAEGTKEDWIHEILYRPSLRFTDWGIGKAVDLIDDFWKSVHIRRIIRIAEYNLRYVLIG